MLGRLWKIIDEKLESWLIIGSYGYLVFIILIEIIRRYAIGASSQWGEMTARYAFVFLVYLATAHIARSRDHIRIDLVPKLVTDRTRLWLYLYFDFLHLVLVALTVYYSVKIVALQIRNEVLMTGLDINMAVAHVVLPIGFSLLGLRVVQRSTEMIRQYRSTGTVSINGEIQNV